MFSARSRLALCGFFLLSAFASMALQTARADEAASSPRVAMKVPSQTSPSDLPPSHDAAPANIEEDKAERERQEQLRTVSIMNYTSKPVGYRLLRTRRPNLDTFVHASQQDDSSLHGRQYRRSVGGPYAESFRASQAMCSSVFAWPTVGTCSRS